MIVVGPQQIKKYDLRLLGRIRRMLFLGLAILAPSCGVNSDRSSSTINVRGCQVDLKQICQVYFDLPDEYLALSHLDSESMKRAPNQIDTFFPGPPALVWCTYDKLQRKVIAAGLGQEGPLTDSQIADARAKGFCTKDAKQLREALIREHTRRMKSGPGGRTGTFIQPLNAN